MWIQKGAFEPNSALWLKLNALFDGASLDIKKRNKLVYINIFCLDIGMEFGAFAAVQGLYNRYNLGLPQRPIVEAWIHSIPVDFPL